MKHIYMVGLLAALLLPLPLQAAGMVKADLSAVAPQAKADLSAVAPQAKADDTVAGLGTDIDLAGFAPGAQVDLVVTPPIGPQASAPVTLDATGNASVHIETTETELAGRYSVSVEAGGSSIAQTNFTVLADRMSAQQSAIQASKDRVQPDGRDAVDIIVTLRDVYGNPLAAHSVTLVGRTGDQISPITPRTADDGSQHFRLTTTEAGTITLRAIDMVSGMVLDGGANILAQNASIGGPYPTPYQNPYAAPQYAAPTPYAQQPYAPPAPQAYPPAYQNPYGYTPPAYQRNTQRTFYGLGSNAQPQQPGYSPYGPSNPGASPLAASLLGRNLFGQAGSTGPVIDHFEIVTPPIMKLNEDGTIRIIAVDSAGRKVEDYVGSVLLSTTDPAALLPLGGEIEFLPSNFGEKTLTLGLRFRSPGELSTSGNHGAAPNDIVTTHVLLAVDSTDERLQGQSVIDVIGGNPFMMGERIMVSTPQDGSVVTDKIVEVKGITKPFHELKVTGGTEEVAIVSDINGEFTTEITLDATKSSHSIRVQDSSGQLDSWPIAVTLDNDAPTITGVSFSPTQPVEGAKTLLVVEADSGSTITALINEETYTLEESANEPGSYEVLFTAPAGDTYTVNIEASDTVGNVTKRVETLVVDLKGLRAVTNVVAEGKDEAVTLHWDPLEGEDINAYRIYVGETPEEFAFSLETQTPTTAAEVVGLRPGRTYYFAVTALQGKRESEDYSNVASATVRGLQLLVTEQDSSLLLDWSSLSTDTELSSFTLEYGATEGAFSEKRILTGDLRTFVLRDLINDVRYYLKLTPISITGETIEDLSARASGIPTSLIAGFRPSRGDAIPEDLTLHSAPPPLNEKAPQTVPSGLPGTVLFILGPACAIGLYVFLQRRRKLQTVAFLQTMDLRYRQ